VEMTEQTSVPGVVAPMAKCLRSAAEVAWARVRARETVRVRDGSAAEMWIAVSGFARQWGESGGFG
jgi:hypothetical protein